MKKSLIGGADHRAVVVTGGVLLLSKKESGPKFRKEKITKGEVVSTVTATGTLSAVTTVKVGSQVSGIIASLHVDFNSEVKKGQLLAGLDPTPFQRLVDQRRADLERAKVELRNAELVLSPREEAPRGAAAGAVRVRHGQGRTRDGAAAGGRAVDGGPPAGRDEPRVHAGSSRRSTASSSTGSTTSVRRWPLRSRRRSSSRSPRT